MARSSFDFDGGLSCALYSVKQESLTPMAEQTQALKLLSERRDGLTVIRDNYHRRKELLFRHLVRLAKVMKASNTQAS